MPKIRDLDAHEKAGALHQEIQLLRFVNRTVFETKNGSFGMVLQPHGIDPECRMEQDVDTYSRRVEKARKVFDERFRVYEYVIKRLNPLIPHRDDYPSRESQEICLTRVNALQSRAQRLSQINLYMVVIFEPDATKKLFGLSLRKSLAEYEDAVRRGMDTLTSSVGAFAASVDDMLAPEILTEREATAFFRQLVNPDPVHAANWRFKPGEAALDYIVGDTAIWPARDHLRIGDYYAVTATVKATPVRPRSSAIASALLNVPCDFIACMEWKLRTTIHMRGLIKSLHKTFDAQKISMLMMALHPLGAWTPLSEMKRKHDVEHHADNLGQALVAIEDGAAFGDFSCVIVLLGTDLHHVRNSFSELVKVYGQTDASLIRETLNSWSAFRSIIPGNTKFNHSYSYLLNTDYANLSFTWNGYTGSPVNEHLDDEYLCLYETDDQRLFYFNGHVGGTFGILKLGAPESGKSFDTNYQIAHIQKYDPITLILDIGGSYRDVTRQFGGAYYGISQGHQADTMNPFALADTYENKQFLFYLVRSLIGRDEGLAREEAGREDRAIHDAVEMIYALSPQHRRLKYLSLPRALKMRLRRWCEGGQYGHIFDNERDTIRFTHFQTFEFQGMEKATDLLVAMCFYITHRFDAVVYDPAVSARVKLLAIDEGWRWMLRGDMGLYMVEKLKTGRKHNLCDLFVTQSALDAERAGFGELLNEACPTKIFFANPEIKPETYEKVYGLNPKQALRVSQLKPRQELAIFASDPARPTYKQFKVVKLVIDDAETVLAYSNDPNANRTKFNRALGASA